MPPIEHARQMALMAMTWPRESGWIIRRELLLANCAIRRRLRIRSSRSRVNARDNAAGVGAAGCVSGALRGGDRAIERALCIRALMSLDRRVVRRCRLRRARRLRGTRRLRGGCCCRVAAAVADLRRVRCGSVRRRLRIQRRGSPSGARRFLLLLLLILLRERGVNASSRSAAVATWQQTTCCGVGGPAVLTSGRLAGP